MSIQKQTVLSCLYLLLSFNLSGQTKDAVILYNGDPFKVDLSPIGEILQFHGPAIGYMEGFQLYKTNLSNVPLANMPPLNQFKKKKIFSEQKDSLSHIAAGIIPPNAKLRFDYDSNKVRINFDSNFGVLTDESLKNIDAALAKTKSIEQVKVSISVYKNLSDHNRLTYNRFNSTKNYLALKGVKKSNIHTEITEDMDMKHSMIINIIE